METRAWHLRQDGAAYAVPVHMYVTNDEDFASEAEVASFLIYSKSKDISFAETVLDVWMAMLIEDTVTYGADSAAIDEAIESNLQLLPYKFNYMLTSQQYLDIHHKLDNYHDMDTLYDFLDEVRGFHQEEYSDAIKKSFNQQFCRVRYGGQYDSAAGDSSIWFRISSVGFNWADTIYVFTANNRRKLNIQSVYICRDYESDNGEEPGKPEYFYKAKDGAVYFNMPIEEYLAEEHEHSPVFSSTHMGRGVLATMYDLFKRGKSYVDTLDVMGSYVTCLGRNPWGYFVKKDSQSCVDCSDFLERARGGTITKVNRIVSKILNHFPEISSVDVDIKPHENSAGKLVGVKYFFTLEFDDPNLKSLTIDIPFTKGDVTPDVVFRRFRQEYLDYKTFTA